MQNDFVFLAITATVVFLIFSSFIISFTLLFLKRQLENLKEKQTLQSQYEQAILQSQIEIQNQTLQTIGQELHDNIGQILTVVRLQLNILEETNQQPTIQGYIEQSNGLINEAIYELRALSKSLDGFAVQDFGLVKGIGHELQRLDKTSKFKTELQTLGDPYSLGSNEEIIIFRVVQELLNNTIKHAQATRILVMLNYQPELFSLVVQDNGRGFNFLQIKQNLFEERGSGLRNIQRRVGYIGGECAFDSQIGQGTIVRIKIKISSIDS